MRGREEEATWLLSRVNPPDAALYFITAKYGHSWSHFRDTGDGSIFIGGKVMRTRVRSPTYGREKKKTTSPEDFTNKRVESFLYTINSKR